MASTDLLGGTKDRSGVSEGPTEGYMFPSLENDFASLLKLTVSGAVLAI